MEEAEVVLGLLKEMVVVVAVEICEKAVAVGVAHALGLFNSRQIPALQVKAGLQTHPCALVAQVKLSMVQKTYPHLLGQTFQS
jgi:hypothetical protein